MWRDVATLISISESVNEYGDIVAAESFQEVYCNVLSVSQKEFYQAQSVGFQPELKLEMMAIDYDSQKYIEIYGKRYKILRTYVRKDEVIELVVSSLIERND